MLDLRRLSMQDAEVASAVTRMVAETFEHGESSTPDRMA